MTTRTLRAALSLAALALLPGPAANAQSQRMEWPQTRAERTDYWETSRHADVLAFLDEIVDRSHLLHRTSMGYTMEGRDIPLIIAGAVDDPTPEGIAASGKLRIYLQGNIHAGEVCGKEALLMLLRQIAQGNHANWFDSVVLLIAPIYNGDGNERVLLTNRPGQNGPYGGMGQRPNAQGLDLNRDHMKLESPEARSLLAMMRNYDPQVSVDLHTTNGTRHAYHVTYSPPLNPNTHPAIDNLLREDWLPNLTANVRSKHGWEYYYYGNLPFGGEAERAWYTFDHRPRFNNNYIGLRNRVAILSEAYSYATFEERVFGSLYFVEEVVDYAAANQDAIRGAIATAEAASIAGTELAVRSTFARSDEPTEILLGETRDSLHPLTGRRLSERLDVVTPERMYEYGTFAATETATVPDSYLVPAELALVVDRLRSHGIAMTRTAAPMELQVERFRISDSSVAAREFQGHQERTLEGAYEAATLEVPAGTWQVSTAQPLGRLVFYLLEPRSDDGLTNWNFLDRALEGTDLYPILRTR